MSYINPTYIGFLSWNKENSDTPNVSSDFEREKPFRDFAARHEVTQGVSKSKGLAIRRVFAIFIFSRFSFYFA